MLTKLSPQEITEQQATLFKALQSNDTGVMRSTIDKLPSESLLKSDDNGNTPLHYFAKQPSSDLTALFLLLSKLTQSALISENKNKSTPRELAASSKNHIVSSAIQTVYAILKPHGEDSTIEIVLGRELAKQVFDKLFSKLNEQTPSKS